MLQALSFVPASIRPALVRVTLPRRRHAATAPARVTPAARDPGARWQPRRWLLALPALLDEHDLAAWLRWAPAGCEVAYHVGPSLAAAREADPTLDALARALLCRTGAEWAITTPPPCGHVRALVLGSGELELVQRRGGPAGWLYLARRRWAPAARGEGGGSQSFGAAPPPAPGHSLS